MKMKVDEIHKILIDPDVDIDINLLNPKSVTVR